MVLCQGLKVLKVYDMECMIQILILKCYPFDQKYLTNNDATHSIQIVSGRIGISDCLIISTFELCQIYSKFLFS